MGQEVLWRRIIMKSYDKVILDTLLTSYEKSKLYTAENKQNIGIHFQFNKSKLPEYFNEESTVYEGINEQMVQIEAKGFISIQWKEQKVGHIIAKVTLQVEQLESIYTYLKRQPKKQSEAHMQEVLTKYVGRHPIGDCFIHYTKQRIEKNESVKRYFDIQQMATLEELLKGLLGVVSNQQECYLRELSMKLFADSKKLEQLEGKIKHIIEVFGTKEALLQNTEEVFAEFNVFKNPSYVMIKGCGSLQIGDNTIKLEQIPNGLGINSRDLEQITFNKEDRIKGLITIENLTAFNRIKKEEWVIVYLGGYHNIARRKLIQTFYEAYPHVQYAHWGDMDCGGIQIYYDLVTKTHIPFQPYKMDLATIKYYRHYGKPLTEQDQKVLKKMQEDKNYDLFQEEIAYMIENKIKLEQEIVAYLQA